MAPMPTCSSSPPRPKKTYRFLYVRKPGRGVPAVFMEMSVKSFFFNTFLNIAGVHIIYTHYTFL